MTIAASTGRVEDRPCDKCSLVLPHREHATLSCGPERTWWMPEKHEAPCGLPCMSGGVKPAQIRGDGVHGYRDRCLRCGPLRVLPEVAEEMRQRAASVQRMISAATPGPVVADKEAFERTSVYYWIRTAAPIMRRDPAPPCPRSIAWLCGSLGEAQTSRRPADYRDDSEIHADAALAAAAWNDMPALAADVLRCLDEIAKLTRERDEARAALGDAREQVTMLRMEIADMRIEAEEAAEHREYSSDKDDT